MKRFTIGLTLLFALMNTGCEDAKAESKDYDVEIAELQQQITQLSSRLDSLITVVPTNTNIAQLSSRLDSVISVLPQRKVYEVTTGSDGTAQVNINELSLSDFPNVSIYVKMDDAVNGYVGWYKRDSGNQKIEDGLLNIGNDGYQNTQMKVVIIK